MVKPEEKEDLKLVEKLAQGRESILEQLHKIIVGQDEVISQDNVDLYNCRDSRFEIPENPIYPGPHAF
jgi:hypothetical protein